MISVAIAGGGGRGDGLGIVFALNSFWEEERGAGLFAGLGTGSEGTLTENLGGLNDAWSG